MSAADQPKPWTPSPLTLMLLMCQREADRIETWQSSREGAGIIVPPDRWDARQRLDFELYRRIASLCHTVSLVDSNPKTSAEFRRLVKKVVGTPPPAKAEPDAETTDESAA